MSIVVDQPAEHVLTIGINRPAARNAVDGPTARALAEEFRAFDADPDCTSPCCTGSSGTFCAGADLKQIGSGNGNRVERDMSVDGPMGPDTNAARQAGHRRRRGLRRRRRAGTGVVV